MIIIKIVTFILIILIIYMICKSNIVKTNFLFFVASYGVNQLDFLYTQLKSFVLICESGYEIKIVVHHTHILKNSSFKSFYCFNIKGYIDINYIKISPMVKDYLTKEHRKYIIENLKEIKKYDHIGYFEDDMGFNLAHLKYYIYTQSLIKKYNIKNARPGYNRFEITKCNNGDIWRSCPDVIDYVELYIIKKKPFVNIISGYSAMWLVPQKELIKYVNDKDFLEIQYGDYRGRAGIKEYYSYFYWEKYYKPLVPLDRIDDSFVHHMSNKYIRIGDSIQITEFYKQMNIVITENGLKYIGELKNKVIKINSKYKSKYCVNM